MGYIVNNKDVDCELISASFDIEVDGDVIHTITSTPSVYVRENLFSQIKLIPTISVGPSDIFKWFKVVVTDENNFVSSSIFSSIAPVDVSGPADLTKNFEITIQVCTEKCSLCRVFETAIKNKEPEDISESNLLESCCVIPPGGITGQLLAKKTDEDCDFVYIDSPVCNFTLITNNNLDLVRDEGCYILDCSAGLDDYTLGNLTLEDYANNSDTCYTKVEVFKKYKISDDDEFYNLVQKITMGSDYIHFTIIERHYTNDTETWTNPIIRRSTISNSEHVIGYKSDKPIYRKSFNVSFLNVAEINIEHNLDIDKYLKVSYISENTGQNIPTCGELSSLRTNGNVNQIINYGANSIYIEDVNNNLFMSELGNTEIIIEYTKL